MTTTHNARHALHEFDAVARIRDNAGMSVEFETDRAALAGSTGINNTPGGSTVTETPLVDPGANAGQDGTPRRGGSRPRRPKPGVLVLTCDRCHRAIVGTGAGYAYVSLVDAQRTAKRVATGYHDRDKATWTLAHRGCAPEALAPMAGRYVLWTDRITTTDALLDAMVTLSRERWFAWTDWGALARRILADTETASLRAAARTEGDIAAYANRAKSAEAERRAAERDEQRRQRQETRLREAEQRRRVRLGLPDQDEVDGTEDKPAVEQSKVGRAQRRQEQAEAFRNDPSDERHGTTNGYNNSACRCDRCREAHTEAKRSLRERTER